MLSRDQIKESMLVGLLAGANLILLQSLGALAGRYFDGGEPTSWLWYLIILATLVYAVVTGWLLLRRILRLGRAVLADTRLSPEAIDP
jgi:hypothetical protein